MDEQIPTFPPPTEFAAQAVAGADLYEEAAEDRLAYWARRAREVLHWEQDFTEVLDWNDAPRARWFADGKINAAVNAVDRHVEAGRGDQLAIIHDSPITRSCRGITYAELRDRVASLAGALRAKGIEKGDRVIIYMPMVPEALEAMLARRYTPIMQDHYAVLGEGTMQISDTLRAALDSAHADAARFSPRPEWNAMLARHAEGSQVTQGAFERPWK